MGEEEKRRRRLLRVNVNFKMTVIRVKNGQVPPPNPLMHLFEVINLNSSGMKIRTSLKLNAGDRLSIRFLLPKQKVLLSPEGEVRWCTVSEKQNGHFEAGVKFLNLTRSDEEYLSLQMALNSN